MNHLKDSPKGIDVLIQKLQVKLYKALGNSDIHGFGRVYLNDDDGKKHLNITQEMESTEKCYSMTD